MRLIPKIWPWWKAIKSKKMEVRKIKFGTQDIKHKGQISNTNLQELIL